MEFNNFLFTKMKKTDKQIVPVRLLKNERIFDAFLIDAADRMY